MLLMCACVRFHARACTLTSDPIPSGALENVKHFTERERATANGHTLNYTYIFNSFAFIQMIHSSILFMFAQFYLNPNFNSFLLLWAYSVWFFFGWSDQGSILFMRPMYIICYNFLQIPSRSLTPFVCPSSARHILLSKLMGYSVKRVKIT